MPNSGTSKARNDDGHETSVNWEDNSTVLQFTLADTTIAEFGAARIGLSQIHSIAKIAPNIPSALKCERKKLHGNPFHGNIVFSNSLENLQQKQLASALALASGEFIEPRIAAT
jgi:hypothetical protein